MFRFVSREYATHGSRFPPAGLGDSSLEESHWTPTSPAPGKGAALGLAEADDPLALLQGQPGWDEVSHELGGGEEGFASTGADPIFGNGSTLRLGTHPAGEEVVIHMDRQ